VLSWAGIRGPKDVSAKALALFNLVNPRPDVLIIGLGKENYSLKDLARKTIH